MIQVENCIVWILTQGATCLFKASLPVRCYSPTQLLKSGPAKILFDWHLTSTFFGGKRPFDSRSWSQLTSWDSSYEKNCIWIQSEAVLTLTLHLLRNIDQLTSFKEICFVLGGAGAWTPDRLGEVTCALPHTHNTPSLKPTSVGK